MASPVYLSILIPVYNWDIGPLLTALAAQVLALAPGRQVEIIVLDDGSTAKFTNKAVADQLLFVRYEESAVNKGRAETRNALLLQAQGLYVLFLDADMLPDRHDFIQTYLAEAQQGGEIVCGGISYQQHDKPAPEYSFYLYKSHRTEALSSVLRAVTPWRYLFTSNIMVRREIMQTVRFDARFTGYGFEDIEWGVRLGDNFTIRHIENTCSHMGLMTKQHLLAKMRDSIPNYALLLALHPVETGHCGAAALAFFVKWLPAELLMAGDWLLNRLFAWLPWNWPLFLIFQCDKALLLAQELKKNSGSNRPLYK